jgi:hypothetical protein
VRRLYAVLAFSFAIAARAEGPGETPESSQQFGETMTVVRYLVEARVSDDAGRPVTDLAPSDFIVTIGDAVAHVEAADWISFTRPPVASPSLVAGAAEQEPASEGRLVVFFVQTDFARDASRIKGHMQFTTFFAEKIVGMFQPDDRVAIVAFDSRLKVLCDFTSDRGRVLRVLKDSLDSSKVAPAKAQPGASLVAAIDPKQAQSAARGEEALLLVARALTRIEGNKLMFLAGWGFGDMIWGMGGGGQLVLPPEFNEAIGLLYRNRVPVVTVGTGAGQLTAGIALTARATGGIHTSARANFPEQMLTRIEGFVAGSYELVLRTDTPLASGEYLISVRTKDPRLHVRAAPAIVIDAVDMRYADAVAMLNAGAVDEGVQLLRESMASAGLPREVLVERLSAFVDAAQWEAALAVVERLEAAGAIDDEVAQLRDEVKRGAAARTRMSAQTLLTAARKALLAGDDRKGLALLEQALAVDPGLAEPWFERGMLLLALGKTEDARASLERCLALDPHGVNAATAREVIAGLGE